MIYKVHMVDHGGEMPYVSPLNSEALLEKEDIIKKADNPEVLSKNGINHLGITAYPDHWHICQVSGYTPDARMFCSLY